MSRNRKGMNKHQKAAFRPGEHRIRQNEVTELLDLAQSANPDDRFVAASNLCPCHVRKPIPEVQQAIFRLMEDPDVRVRRAAWHTIEDGGVPEDPQLDAIYERAVARGENDNLIRWIMREFVAPRVEARRTIESDRARQTIFALQGRCDFCGAGDVFVTRDYQTEIATVNGERRLALTCEACYGG